MRVISPQFQQALMKLSNQDLPLSSAKKVLETLRLVKQATSDYHDDRIKFMGELAEKDSEGNPKLDEKENFVFPQENLEKVNTKLKEIMTQEIELPKIPEKDLGDAKLSAQEYSLLEHLFI